MEILELSYQDTLNLVINVIRSIISASLDEAPDGQIITTRYPDTDFFLLTQRIARLLWSFVVNASLPVLQLSVSSRNDPGSRYSSRLSCTLLQLKGGFLGDGSWGTDVILPVNDSVNDQSAQWFLLPELSLEYASVSLVISCPDSAQYPACPITIKGSEIIQLMRSSEEKQQRIHRKGCFGVTSELSNSKQGPVLSIYAGVYCL